MRLPNIILINSLQHLLWKTYNTNRITINWQITIHQTPLSSSSKDYTSQKKRWTNKNYQGPSHQLDEHSYIITPIFGFKQWSKVVAYVHELMSHTVHTIKQREREDTYCSRNLLLPICGTDKASEFYWFSCSSQLIFLSLRLQWCWKKIIIIVSRNQFISHNKKQAPQNFMNKINNKQSWPQ